MTAANRGLENKTVLLTGGTEGIGKAAARDFAAQGANLVIVGRNASKTQAVRDELVAQTGNQKITTLLGDLSVLADVRRVAAEFKAKHDVLHVLANNAGAMFDEHKLSADGFEMTFALNHLSYFLLTQELLPLIRKTPGARVVSTSSNAHRPGKIDLETIAKRPNGSAGWGAYCDSKLANILFTKSLAKRLEGTDAKANCFHPGFVRTGFAQNNEGLMKSVIKFVAALVARTPEKGAETLVWLASAPEAGQLQGEYCADRKVANTVAAAKDMDKAEALWALSEKLTAAKA